MNLLYGYDLEITEFKVIISSGSFLTNSGNKSYSRRTLFSHGDTSLVINIGAGGELFYSPTIIEGNDVLYELIYEMSTNSYTVNDFRVFIQHGYKSEFIPEYLLTTPYFKTLEKSMDFLVNRHTIGLIDNFSKIKDPYLTNNSEVLLDYLRVKRSIRNLLTEDVRFKIIDVNNYLRTIRGTRTGLESISKLAGSNLSISYWYDDGNEDWNPGEVAIEAKYGIDQDANIEGFQLFSRTVTDYTDVCTIIRLLSVSSLFEDKIDKVGITHSTNIETGCKDTLGSVIERNIFILDNFKSNIIIDSINDSNNNTFSFYQKPDIIDDSIIITSYQDEKRLRDNMSRLGTKSSYVIGEDSFILGETLILKSNTDDNFDSQSWRTYDLSSTLISHKSNN